MKKRIVCFLLVVCLVTAMLPMSVMAASAPGTLDNPWTDGGMKAYLDGTVLHVYGSGTIPDYVNGKQPWYGKSGVIDTVVIETGITGIGNNAFSCCGGLQSLTLKWDVSNTGAIAMGVNSIPSGIDVNIEVTGSGYMTEYDSTQPWANLKTKITSVTLDEGVQSIGKQAFSGCTKLKSVTIPSTVEIIGQEAFANCVSLTDVLLKHDFANGLQIGSNAFPVANSGFRINMQITGSAAVPNYANANEQPWAPFRTYIRNLTIDGDVAGIGDNAFSGCTGLTAVTMFFNEHGLKAQKVLGANWLRENSEIPVSIQAVSETAAFKTWGGASVASAKADTTLLFYDRNGVTVTAAWEAGVSGIVIEPKDNKVFPEMEVGYAQFEPYAVTVKNTGNQATGRLVVELTSGQTAAFELSAHELESIPVGGTATFSVAPKTGLSAGEYSSIVAVSNDEGVVASFRVSFIASTDQSRVERFVKRLYEKCLEREGDAEGINTWVTQLQSGQMTAAQVAANFYSSKEFRMKGLSNEDFVKNLYRTMLNREAEAAGLKNWVEQLKAGKTRSWLFKQFCDSAEFQLVCQNHTLTAGTIDHAQYDMSNMSKPVDINQAVAFVTRLYNVTLDREPDTAGLNNWVGHLVNKRMSGAGVAAGFFASAEYRGKNNSNTQFITDLYATLLDRAPDAAGLKTWGDQLAGGTSRSEVFKQICESPEFNSLCESYGISAGTIVASAFDMGAVTGTNTSAVSQAAAESFVKQLYLTLLGRTVDASGLKTWSEQLMSGKGGAEVAVNLAASAEFKAKGLSNEDFVKALYRALLGREVDAAGLGTWVGQLNGGTSRAEVFKSLCDSAEFQSYCAGLGINAGTINAASWNLG